MPLFSQRDQTGKVPKNKGISMTDRISILLIVLVLGFLTLDFTFINGLNTVFLLKKFVDLLHILAIWR